MPGFCVCTRMHWLVKVLSAHFVCAISRFCCMQHIHCIRISANLYNKWHECSFISSQTPSLTVPDHNSVYVCLCAWHWMRTCTRFFLVFAVAAVVTTWVHVHSYGYRANVRLYMSVSRWIESDSCRESSLLDVLMCMCSYMYVCIYNMEYSYINV